MLYPNFKSFDPDTFTLLLDVERAVVNLNGLSVKAKKNGFEQKNEFHITVIGFKNGLQFKEALHDLPETKRNAVLIKIKALIGRTDWGFMIDPRRFHITKDYLQANTKADKKPVGRKEAYIQMIALPAIDGFYEKLNTLLATDVQAPPAHITLYTKEDANNLYKGIVIDSAEDFAELNPASIS